MSIKRTDFRGPEVLRHMQSLVQREWTLHCNFHIGDLAWRWHSTGEKLAEWPTALWMEGDNCVGWGWIELPGELWFKVSRSHPELAFEILDWFEETASGNEFSAEVLDKEQDLIAPLINRGFEVETEGMFSRHTVCNLNALPVVKMPSGFKAYSMADEISPALRASAHALAWSVLPFRENGRQVDTDAKSRVTETTHLQIMKTWPYRKDLDWIILAPDGTPAACCIMWYDEANGVGELEPVGTHPDYRRLGLGEAVCLSAMRALKAAGATRAIVYPRGDDAYPVPGKLYARLGFEPYGRTLTYTKER